MTAVLARGLGVTPRRAGPEVGQPAEPWEAIWRRGAQQSWPTGQLDSQRSCHTGPWTQLASRGQSIVPNHRCRVPRRPPGNFLLKQSQVYYRLLPVACCPRPPAPSHCADASPRGALPRCSDRVPFTTSPPPPPPKPLVSPAASPALGQVAPTHEMQWAPPGRLGGLGGHFGRLSSPRVRNAQLGLWDVLLGPRHLLRAPLSL